MHTIAEKIATWPTRPIASFPFITPIPIPFSEDCSRIGRYFARFFTVFDWGRIALIASEWIKNKGVRLALLIFFVSFVVDRGFEPLCRAWEARILALRWIHHFLFGDAKIRQVFIPCKFFEQKNATFFANRSQNALQGRSAKSKKMRSSGAKRDFSLTSPTKMMNILPISAAKSHKVVQPKYKKSATPRDCA